MTPFGALGAKKGAILGAGAQDGDAHGILEGISSLHSWIKTQTMIRPNPKAAKGKASGIFDEVRVRFVHEWQARFSVRSRRENGNQSGTLRRFFKSK